MLDSLRELSFVSHNSFTHIAYTRYTLPSQDVKAIARRLKQEYQQPIFPDPSTSSILSAITLPLSATDYPFITQEVVNLVEHRSFFFKACNFAMVDAYKEFTKVDEYRKRIYSGKPITPTKNYYPKQYITFDFALDLQQHLVLSIDSAHEYLSRHTVHEIGIQTLQIEDRLIHSYDSKACEFMGVGADTIATPLKVLNNKSLIEYHQEKGHIPSGVSLDPNTISVKVRYSGNFEALHIPQLLFKIYDREDIDENEFMANLLSIDKKVELAIKNIEFINRKDRFRLPDTIITFDNKLRKPKVWQFVHGEYETNLNFGLHKFAYQSTGVKNYHLWGKPQQIKSTVIYPQTWRAKVDRFIDELCNEYRKFGTQLIIEKALYSPQDSSQIQEICQHFSECDIVIACVPNHEDPEYNSEVNAYTQLKVELAKRRIPSQMIKHSTIKNCNKYMIFNIILGINAKLGYSGWRLEKMPGAPDAFIGLDIGRKYQKAIGAAAFVVNGLGELLGWGNQELPAYQETFSSEGLEELLENLCDIYRCQYGKPLNHLIVHRDGKLVNVEYATFQKLQMELGIKLDVVEVIKSGTCRAVKVDKGGNYFNVDKGYGWQCTEKEAIVLTTGDHEVRVNKQASPRPLRICHRIGETDLQTLAGQVYWLSELQIGTTQTIRLPITTYYADRAAEESLEGRLPLGLRQEKGLWFL